MLPTMAVGLAFVLLAGFAVRGVGATDRLRTTVFLSHSKCAGHERWKIKTLTDDEADEVNTTAKTTTVDELRANDTRPAKVSASVGRIHSVEFRRYRVHATLRKALREDDGDLHVVIHDPDHDGESDPSHTMIVEFPDTSCEPQKSSAYAPQMEKARAAFVALVKQCTGYDGKFGSLLKFKLHATITGVGFWDLKHGNPQLGRAPNDLELHPVLKVTQATCT
jgi:hypothetical protein